MCQLARSPVTDTWKAPSTQTSRRPPRIIAKESAWWKYAAPGSSVTACLPALMRSQSSRPAAATGPIPSMPFSVCRTTPDSALRCSATLVGWPMPRFAFPALLLTMVRSMAPWPMSASMSAYGIPTGPKPPTSTVDPWATSATASSAAAGNATVT